MNTEQRIVRLLVGGPAAATLGMQALCAISVGDLLAYRVGVLLLSIGLLAWIWRSNDIVIGPLVPRLAFCLVAAASFSLSLLETLLLRGPVFARGVLGLIAAASIYATLLLALTRPRARDSFAGWLVVHLGLAVSAVVVALAAVEATFHATTPANLYEIVPDDPRSAPCIIRQPVLGWQLRPGFRGRYLHPEFPGSRVDINDLGFRDGLEETAPPLPGHASVLVLGDSLAFGTGVELEETFHRILERRGPEITPRPLQVYGAAVPGLCQVTELRQLEAMAPKTRPDVVIVAMYEGNDLNENLWAGPSGPIPIRPIGEPPAPAPPSPPPKPGSTTVPGCCGCVAGGRVGSPPTNPGAVHGPPDVLLRFVRGIGHTPFWLGSSSALQYLLPTVERPLVKLGVVSPLVPTNLMLDRSLMIAPPPVVAEALARTREALAALVRRCGELGADLVVLVIPAAIQAEPARFQDFLAQHREASRGSYSRTQLHRHLVDMVRTLGIRVADPLPRLEAEAEAGRPCYHREGHWNAAGHALAADLLQPVLAELFVAREKRGPRQASGAHP